MSTNSMVGWRKCQPTAAQGCSGNCIEKRARDATSVAFESLQSPSKSARISSLWQEGRGVLPLVPVCGIGLEKRQGVRCQRGASGKCSVNSGLANKRASNCWPFRDGLFAHCRICAIHTLAWMQWIYRGRWQALAPTYIAAARDVVWPGDVAICPTAPMWTGLSHCFRLRALQWSG